MKRNIWICRALIIASLSACSDDQGQSTPDGGDGGPSLDATAVTVDCSECLVLTGARLFDGTSASLGTLVIKGTVIDKVIFGPATVKSGKTVDLSGKTVLPGLIDLHVHLAATAGPKKYRFSGPLDEQHLKSMLRAGVTTFLDAGSSAHRIFGFRQRITAGTIRGPSLAAVGPMVTTSGGHPCNNGMPPGESCLLIDSSADLTRLDALWTQKPDLLKLMIEGGSATKPLQRISLESMSAVAAAAKAKGVKIIAHISATQDIDDALDRGIRLFAHMPSRELIDGAMIKRLVKEHAVIVATVVVVERVSQYLNGNLQLDAKALSDDLPADLLAAFKDPNYLTATQALKDEMATRDKNMKTNLAACIKGGVTVVAGTDAGNPGTFHGLAMHRELQLLVAGGMTTAQAIESATRRAAQMLGMSDRGELKAGQRADLLVVDGDPLAKIDQTEQIHAVYLLGEKVDRGSFKLGGKGTLGLKQVTGAAQDEFCLKTAECATGLVCSRWGSRCRPTCSGSTPAGCQTGSACIQQVLATGTKESFCYQGDGCDLFKQDCANDAACVPNTNGATTCRVADEAKQPGDPCSALIFACAKGSACYNKTCVELCDPVTPTSKACSDSSQTCEDMSSSLGQNVGRCK